MTKMLSGTWSGLPVDSSHHRHLPTRCSFVNISDREVTRAVSYLIKVTNVAVFSTWAKIVTTT